MGQLFDGGAPGNCTRECPVPSKVDPELFSCLAGARLGHLFWLGGGAMINSCLF